MTCFHPVRGFLALRPNVSGKRSVVFGGRAGGDPSCGVAVPCGRCAGCRLDRARDWAVRCMHESQFHVANCFLTLTYDDDHLPEGGTLVKSDFQRFMKRLRRRLSNRVSYFHCGEYGEELGRPHYHCLLFGHDFPDKVFFKRSKSGEAIYRSQVLEELWPDGNSSVQALTLKSAAYCARYSLKKVTGDLAAAHYEVVDRESGEISWKQPEYCTMSLDPAIGKRWFKEWSAEVYPDDFVIMDGRKYRTPRYYDKLLELSGAVESLESVKAARKCRAAEKWADNTDERLLVREEIQLARMRPLKRSL